MVRRIQSEQLHKEAVVKASYVLTLEYKFPISVSKSMITPMDGLLVSMLTCASMLLYVSISKVQLMLMGTW